MGRIPNSVGSLDTRGLLLRLTQQFPHCQDKVANGDNAKGYRAGGEQRPFGTPSRAPQG